jgi:hypothetical protein
MSNGFNAVWVVVKHPTFIPMTMGLDAEGFAELFIKHIASRFGLPYSIIADRNLCWTFDFWKAVSKFLKTRMSLSEIGIECSISFYIGLKDSVCLNYSPCFLVEHCATTKAQLENLD